MIFGEAYYILCPSKVISDLTLVEKQVLKMTLTFNFVSFWGGRIGWSKNN